MKTFAIVTLGCRVNQFESEALVEDLEVLGLVPSGPKDDADLCIINTCAVTSRAAMQSRQAVRKMIRSHPDARIIVTGCNAQVAFDDMAAIQGVDAVIPQSEKERIPDVVSAMIENTPNAFQIQNLPALKPPAVHFSEKALFSGRARPYLKIQDGCNAFCTYCIIPYARGRRRSMLPEVVLKHLMRLKAAGYPEVVLTGIHLGGYGRDLEKPFSLLDLLRQIEACQAVERVRLSSIEPNELTNAVIDFAAKSQQMRTRICPHFHLPLQSGDDEILKRMGRPYTQEMYRDRVRSILAAMPEAAVGADVMVAFPGETDSAFERTASFIEELPLAYLHVFPFSPRPGTPAARFDGRVDARTAKARCRRLRELGRSKRAQFYTAALRRRVDLVMEKEADRGQGYRKGVSETYIPVWLESDTVPPGRMATARIERVDDSLAVFGTVL